MKKSDLYPHFSEEEYERRFERIRNEMSKRGLDCLVIAGSSSYIGGRAASIHYVSNFTEIWGTCDYVILPMNDEPTLLITFGTSHFLNAREVSGFKDIRSGLMGSAGERVVDRLRELKLESGRIGLTECDMMHTTVPLGFYNTLTKSLPGAQFEIVSGLFEELWEIKSKEEIQAMERSAALCDDAVEAVLKMIRPGVKEWEVVAAMKSAILKGGGDPAFVMLAGTSMDDPQLAFANPIPSSRTLKNGDIILNEIAARYNNYETQIGVQIVLGEPTKDYEEIFELAIGAYNRVIECLRPGMTCEDVMKYAGEPLRQAGYHVQAPFVHGIGPGWVAQPLVFLDSFFARPGFSFQPGMTMCAQSHPVRDGDRFFEKRGVFLAGTWLITADKPRCLHTRPVRLEVV